MADGLSKAEIKALVLAEHGNPFSVLGMHEVKNKGVTVRSMQPHVTELSVINTTTGKAFAMECIDKIGLFEVFIPETKTFAYQLKAVYKEGHERQFEDPYRFPLQLTDFDLHLIAEGTHYRTYQKMGAHLADNEGVQGVHFCVWAPNAIRVSITGEFNRWDGRCHPMEQRGHTGIWELFIPDLQQGDLYKFEIKGHNDFLAEKADPYGFAAEVRPQTSSMVWNTHNYEWEDGEWMQQRQKRDWHKSPINVYEVHLGSWKRNGPNEHDWLSYRELADELIPYVLEMGFTHIELLPISEHPFDGSWGYQTIGYYAPTSRFGSPDDFKYFVDQCHRHEVGVLIDWVPAHFPKDGHGLAYFDGTHLYEHSDPRQGEHRDWGTLIFNYGRNEVRSFLLSNAVFWADTYHIDGLRVDAVASMLYLDYSREEGEWIPNEFGGNENLAAVSFLKKFNEVIHAEYPGFITFAEESTAWPMVSRPTYIGGLGFDFKWNMGWMHDTLQYICKDPIHRKYHHGELTFSLLYAFTENFILPFSHDEVVHGKNAMLSKMPGDLWQKFANLRALYTYMFTHPGKNLLFMGCEFGQWKEWDYRESLEWGLLEHDSHRGLQRIVRELNEMVASEKALHQEDFIWEGFEWIENHDSEQSTIAYIRWSTDRKQHIICAINFTPVPREGLRIGVPEMKEYHELLNSDNGHYGGSNVRNDIPIHAEAFAWQTQPYSIVCTLPPLGAVVFAPVISMEE